MIAFCDEEALEEMYYKRGVFGNISNKCLRKVGIFDVHCNMD